MIVAKTTNPILIEKIRERDIKTIMTWFETKKDIYYKASLIYLKDPQEIEEVFYRVIIKIYEENYRIKRDTSFDAWVISILLNECWVRSANNLKEKLDVSEGEMLSKLSQLEKNYKDPLLLSYMMNVTLDEVSQILQIPIQTVKSRLFSGIQLLQNEWEDSTILDGCRQYQDHFINYLDRTLNRERCIELEIHIHSCDSCNNMLFSYQHVILTLIRESESLEIPPAFMDLVTKKVMETEKEIERVKKQVKKKRTLISAILASIITITMFVGFVTNGFSNIYYSWLDWNQLEDKEMLTYLKNGLGEPLNLEAESNGIKVKIKTAIADESQTLIYYEVEDTNEGNEKYAINAFEGVTVENEYDLLNLQAEFLPYIQMGEETLAKKDQNVFSGKLSLLPISKETGTIMLKISKLLEVIEDTSNSENTMYNLNYNLMGNMEGDWSFEIPVTKHASIEHELDKEIEIDGIPIILERIAFAPTTTLLEYRFSDTIQKNKQIQNINIESLERDKQIAQTHNIHYDHYLNDGSLQKSFESLYFEKSKEVNIHFSSINYFVEDHVSFNLNTEGTFPQTFEYVGSSITIEDLTIGTPTKVVFIHGPPEDRAYESLHFEFKTKNENEYVNMNYISNDGVLIDRDGTIYEASEYNIHIVKSEPPRYYETKIESELVRDSSNEQVIPSKLQIYGYSTTNYIDEVVAIQLD
ncbi:DUF4179 domain-containing protein [Bacillus sp. DJP31]|uniref:DUF4179 domain-containing protein n=1 Tax=Bacillus sp. DJP31 TaxID=3409789 RepID=UPI003BB616AD